MIESNEHIPQFTDDAQPIANKLSFVDRYGIHPLFFAFGALVLVFLLYQIGGGVMTFLIIGTTSITRDNVWAMRWLTLAGQLCFILVPTLLLARLFATQLREVFRWRVTGTA